MKIRREDKMKGLLGKKLGMTQIFDDSGNVVPVTLIFVEPNTILEKKTEDKFGYNALKLGIEVKKESRTNKPDLGQFKKIGVNPLRIVKEIKFEKDILDKVNVGEKLDLSILDPSKGINVTGKSKGKGFAGWMKRHGFKGSPDSHGAHEVHRHPGSIGSNTFPGRVFKGKKMAGHYGDEKVTVMNLRIVKIDKEKNILAVKGAIPGHMNSLVIIKQA
ncbi:MAG: 50S ribosomal protein L3 [candidate division TA06 bacterium 32_111]|nr:MAG: 50S ribosomal protein L3 [candidate division TA06 bacterium 32_111]